MDDELDPEKVKAAHATHVSQADRGLACVETLDVAGRLRCEPYRLADALLRALSDSAAIVRFLRTEAEAFEAQDVALYLSARADAIEAEQ